MRSYESRTQNALDEPEIQELLEKYGDKPLVYRGETGEQHGTVRGALEDTECPLKDVLIPMSFENQVEFIKPFIEPEK